MLGTDARELRTGRRVRGDKEKEFCRLDITLFLFPEKKKSEAKRS